MNLPRSRRRNYVASLLLGSWLFALAMGIAHACGLDTELGRASQAVTSSVVDSSRDATSACCEQIGADGLAVPSDFQAIHDQAIEQPLLLDARFDPALVNRSAPPGSLKLRSHPAPAFALNLRFARLAL
jgi:hypothetical protein